MIEGTSDAAEGAISSGSGELHGAEPSGASGPAGGIPVLVRYFAAAADASGLREETLRLAPGPDGRLTAGGLREHLVTRYGAPMAKVLASGSLLIDGTVSRDPGSVIATSAGTEGPARVDILPPFAGG